MMRGAKGWSGLLVAAALAAMVSGCKKDPCADVACGANEACNAETGACEAAGLCKGVTCPGQTGCDPATGACKNLCTGVKNPPTCTLPLACNPKTGACEDRCAAVTCKASETCVPQTGACVDKCRAAGCNAEQKCGADTGFQCVPYCETRTKPAGAADCGAGRKCQKTTGACVDQCDGISCPYGAWCDSGTGACKVGKPTAGRPGAACASATDCRVENAPAGQTFECVQKDLVLEDAAFPEGYCTASCSEETPCPQGSLCVAGRCVDQCTKDADCRNAPQYRCTPYQFVEPRNAQASGQYLCLPAQQCAKAAGCAPVGGDCAAEGDCVSGAVCLTEKDESDKFTGWEGGYCLWAKRGTDRCPEGTTGVSVSQSDNQFAYCLPDCAVELNGMGDGLAAPGACKVGEACVQVSEFGGVCYREDCDADADCQVAKCTAQTASQVCGKGQACSGGACRTADKCATDDDCPRLSQTLHSKCDTVKGECFNTFCEPSLGQCLYDCTLWDPMGDTTGACAGKTCPSGQVCSNDAGGKCVNGVCPSGTSCNATTRRCDRTCADDAACGTNGVCEAGFCVARCTANNAATLCTGGKVCAADGHCVAP